MSLWTTITGFYALLFSFPSTRAYGEESLSSLNDDLLVNICSYLDPSSIGKLDCVNRRLNNVMNLSSNSGQALRKQSQYAVTGKAHTLFMSEFLHEKQRYILAKNIKNLEKLAIENPEVLGSVLGRIVPKSFNDVKAIHKSHVSLELYRRQNLDDPKECALVYLSTLVAHEIEVWDLLWDEIWEKVWAETLKHNDTMSSLDETIAEDDIWGYVDDEFREKYPLLFSEDYYYYYFPKFNKRNQFQLLKVESLREQKIPPRLIQKYLVHEKMVKKNLLALVQFKLIESYLNINRNRP